MRWSRGVGRICLRRELTPPPKARMALSLFETLKMPTVLPFLPPALQ